MICILLGAGSGSRMGALTRHRPKILVEIDRRPILTHTLEAIGTAWPGAHVRIVAGYAAEAVEAYAAGLGGKAGCSVDVVVNRDFATSGPLRSIATALATLPHTDELTIGNGDTIFTARALRTLTETNAPVALLVTALDDAREADADDVQVELGDAGIVRAEKRLGPPGTFAVSAGLLRVAGSDAAEALRRAMREGLAEEAESGRPLTWHSIVARLVAHGFAPQPAMVAREDWWEFDDPLSLERYRLFRETSGFALR